MALSQSDRASGLPGNGRPGAFFRARNGQRSCSKVNTIPSFGLMSSVHARTAGNPWAYARLEQVDV